MDTRLTEDPEEPLAEMPEDVAILYAWANLHGARYRDFSASRREYRAQVRHRAAEDLRLAELNAKAEAERAAVEAERVAGEAERVAQTSEQSADVAERDRALKEADVAARRAAAERVEAARRAEAAAIADAVARREEREMAEAHASAQRQAASWDGFEVRQRSLAGPQPAKIRLPVQASDPYELATRPGWQSKPLADDAGMSAGTNQNGQRPGAFRADGIGSTGLNQAAQPGFSGERLAFRPEMEGRRRPHGYLPDTDPGTRPANSSTGQPEGAAQVFRGSEVESDSSRENLLHTENATAERDQGSGEPGLEQRTEHRMEDRQDQTEAAQQLPRDRERFEPSLREEEQPRELNGPAWLYARESGNTVVPASSVADTLQHSRERVASQWFALKGAFEPAEEAADRPQREREPEMQVPLLAIFSLAGGVGKTSLAATLGRTLSSLGDKVLLADTTTQGLLPYYFGATELRPGAVRTFSPPDGSTDAPIYLVSYEMGDRAGQQAMMGGLTLAAKGMHRVIVDVNAGADWVLQCLAGMNLKVLVPLAPDMNSVISLPALEKRLAGVMDQDGSPIVPFYVMNEFDATLPLHLDVREVLRERLGRQLLPSVIRRAPAVSEALAEGMTVVDYAPDGGIAEDYLKIATWARTLTSAGRRGLRSVRWSER